ncbi:hypothetical protein JYQ62_05180 [Nostoc sp. UHCC 0702]|nr:hypothetical protein JYQ62_05180 [Nostoc sp. UHCC 0702]
MCLNIWKIYFEEQLSEKDLKSILKEAGLVTVAATGVAYIFANAASALASDIFWGIGTVATSTINGIFAILWIGVCEQFYKERFLQPHRV